MAVKYGNKNYRLEQFSGALFRPDLFNALLRGEETEIPATLESLVGEDNAPPLLALSIENALSFESTFFPDEVKRELKIVITEQKGGAGWAALYHRSGDNDIPVGLFPAEKAALKKYTDKENICYEIRVRLDRLAFRTGEMGVSVFNKYNTVESERIWIDLPAHDYGELFEKPVLLRESPVLSVLFAGADDEARDQAETLGKFFTLQQDGNLYSAVETKNLFGEEFTRTGLTQTLEKLSAETDKSGLVVLYIRGGFSVDPLGDLRILPGMTGEEEIHGSDLIESIFNFSSNLVLLFDMESHLSETKIESSLLRLRHRMGSKAMAAAFLAPPEDLKEGRPLISSIMEALSPDFSNAGALTGLTGKRYISAMELLASAGEALAGQGTFISFNPAEDFRIADRFVNTGELKFQTMSSGMLRIDQVDKNPVPLNFGETMIRALPAGNYIIDMVYRNGYRETRIVDLRLKDSAWVIFTYTPSLISGSYSFANLPFGINIAELDPANYEKINREAMEAMGMAPHYVAFLAGENFYKQGSYDRAITEYNRAISLKADYVEAFVSRGNAQRRRGDLNRALEDYNRVLGLKNDYAEVYNYRGFIHAQRGDLNRAIQDYTQAIRYKANYADAFFNRAHAYGKRDSWEEAIADYTQVIKLEPSNAIAYRQRGNAWQSNGDVSKADADYAAARRLER